MWTLDGKPFEPDEEKLKEWTGFVYLITEIDTGKKYVGKKLFWSTRRLPPIKGKKRRRVVVSESDWKTYFGSSETVKQLVESKGDSAFKREILHLCHGKGEMAYLETKEQFDREVLFRDDYYNGIIHCRINQRTVQKMKEHYELSKSEKNRS